MENSLSIKNVLNQRNNYNLAIPFVESQQINPFYKLSVSLLYVDTSDQASQIFKVGSRSLGNNRWEDLFSLTKPFLQRLATEAGIQFAPGSGDIVKVDENTWKASAYGALRLPDGSVRTSNNFKVIDLVTEEKKYRLAYEEKAANGISDEKAAKAVAGKFTGEWKDGVYVIAEQDRGKYIETSLLDAMTQLRANAPQKAATGAILRVIRDLLGIKGTYNRDELKKPFAVARTSFSPDYNDPLIKQMMLQQAMQSVGNIFGNVQPVIQTISLPVSVDEEDGIDMPADPVDIQQPIPAAAPEPEKAEPQASTPKETQKMRSPFQAEPSREMTEEDRSQDFCCDKCGITIKENVWNYSYERFGQPLCMKCQRALRAQQGGAR